jgi:hypothetical protein
MYITFKRFSLVIESRLKLINLNLNVKYFFGLRKIFLNLCGEYQLDFIELPGSHKKILDILA